MTSCPQGSSSVSAALVGLSGTVLEGRYELGRVLGSGGMGAVFEARHLRLDRPVAIKVLRSVYASETEYIERFLREAQSASKVRHRNVVEIHDYGEAAGGLVYSVMEFLVGQDLEQLLRAEGRLSWARACGLLVQIASGLKAAHGQGVIHRDIKPANCFLTDEDGEPVVKLVDFGIAKLEGNDRGHTLTGTAQVLGTPSYIAPELIRTESQASASTDIYAMGVLAYRMLTGRLPFSANKVFEVLRMACFESVPSMRGYVPELPEVVEALVMQMLAKDPEYRPASMLEVRRRLLALSQQTLGAQVVEIPGSSALPLSVGDGGSSSGRTEDTTLPRRAVGGVTERRQVREVGITAVVLEPQLEAPAVSARPPGLPPSVVVTPQGAEALPQVDEQGPVPILAGSIDVPPVEAEWPRVAVPGVSAGYGEMSGCMGAPQAAVHDPSSMSLGYGETVSAIGESTLRSLEQSGSLERSPRRGGQWLALGGLGVLGVVGALVLPVAMEGDERSQRAPEVEERVARVEPAAAEREVQVSVDESTSDVSSESTGGDLVATTMGRTLVSDEGSPEGLVRSGGVEVDLDIQVDAELERPPSPSPAPRPVKKAKEPKKPSGPPKDSALKKRLRKKIASKCAVGEGRLTVKFFVMADGGVMGVTTIPAKPAGACAKALVLGTEFRPRGPRPTPLEIIVE